MLPCDARGSPKEASSRWDWCGDILVVEVCRYMRLVCRGLCSRCGVLALDARGWHKPKSGEGVRRDALGCFAHEES